MNALQLIFACGSCALIIAAFVFIYLSSENPESIWIASLHAEPLWREFIWPVALVALAAIGFLIVTYQGAYALLFWVPNDWGHIDSEGDYQTLRSSLALLLGVASWYCLFRRILDEPAARVKNRHLSLHMAGLQKIIEAYGKPDKLLQLVYFRSVAKDFKNELDKINIESERLIISSKRYAHLHDLYSTSFFLPVNIRYRIYRNLIEIAEGEINRLEDSLKIGTGGAACN